MNDSKMQFCWEISYLLEQVFLYESVIRDLLSIKQNWQTSRQEESSSLERVWWVKLN